VPDADLRAGDMQFLPYDDDRFDLVTGFNSFFFAAFFAADLAAALRKAGPVAKPGAPVVIQVWGRPERCSIETLKSAVAQFMPGGSVRPAPAARLLEARRARRHRPRCRPYADGGVRHHLGVRVRERRGGDARDAGRRRARPRAGEAGGDVVRTATLESLAPYRNAGGGYVLRNEFHFMIATAPA
jgi:SAM-dependent methyltransferase